MVMDAWIIEEIKKQEEADRVRDEARRLPLELPVPPPGWAPRDPAPESIRGVVVIDLY